MTGDNLRLGQGAGNTTPLLNTTFQLVGPDAVNHQVVTPVNAWLTCEDIGKGQAFYSLRHGTDPNIYRIVNNKTRIYSTAPNTPLQKGNWRLVISDIQNAKMVIGQYPFTV